MDWAWIRPRIAPRGGGGQPLEIMVPAPRVARALFSVGQPGMRHPQERATILFDQVDLHQARPGGVASMPSQPKL